MKKTGYVCFPCWKETGRDKPYSRSYDLIAHMVNVHEKYPEGAVNKTAYSTDGSNIRDATEDEKIRYRDANKHRRKVPVEEKSSSSEPSHSGTALAHADTTKARPASAREVRGGRGASSDDRGVANSTKEIGRKSKSTEGEHGSTNKRDDREASRGHSDRESQKSGRETIEDVEPDEEEIDRRKMAEIQSRMEARKAAKDLDLAHATIAELKATYGSSVTAPEKTAAKKVPDPDKKVGMSRSTKKVMAPLTVAVPIDTLPVASVIAGPPNPTTEPSVGAGLDRGRATRRAGADCRGDDALATLNFGAITGADWLVSAPCGDTSNTTLGIALVAGALGRKVPRLSNDLALAGMTECYVGLAPTRKGSKALVAVAPPNSLESDDVKHADSGSEVRLSQSDVHIGFPGDVGEAATDMGTVGQTTEVAVSDIVPGLDPTQISRGVGDPDGANVLDTGMSGVDADEKVSDTPTASGEITTPVSEQAGISGSTHVPLESLQTPVATIVVPGSAEEKAMWRVKRDNKEKMIREFAASQLLQEELAKTAPNLVSVASFLNKVCGTGSGAQQLRETAGLLIQKKPTEEAMPRTSMREADATGKDAASPVLEPPAEARDSNTVLATGGAPVLESRVGTVGVESRDAVTGDLGLDAEASDEVVQCDGEPNVTLHTDTCMSIGSSTEESPEPSTCGLSDSAGDSRKRAAD